MPIDPSNMSDSGRNTLKVLLGIDLPPANAPSMRAVSEIYDRLSNQLTGELTDVMNTTRSRVRRNFGGAASGYYERSLAAFTSGERDYIGKAASTGRMLSVELRKAAANLDYMVAMVWVQLAQLIAEIAWAIASAKFTFGASLSWIPVFKAIRSLAIRRLLAWVLITVPSHQIVSHVFASFGELIQRIQIANGERDEFDNDLRRGAHVGAVFEGLVSAGISGGLGMYFKNGFTEIFVRNIDDLRALPDPVPFSLKSAVPDPGPLTRTIDDDPLPGPGPGSPVPAPGPLTSTLNKDLADLFSRHKDEMLVPFHPNSPPGARAWDNAAAQAAFRDDMANVFQRSFAGSLGADRARLLGDGYANTLIRAWSDPDLGTRLSKALGDELPPYLRDHLAGVPQDLFGSLRQGTSGLLQYVRQLGIGAGSGAAEGTLGEGLGNAAGGQGFTVTPWSATSGATLNPAQQVTSDSALVGIDSLRGPGGTIAPPELPLPTDPDPKRGPQGEQNTTDQGVPPAASGSETDTDVRPPVPSSEAGERPTVPSDPPKIPLSPAVGEDRPGPAPARGDTPEQSAPPRETSPSSSESAQAPRPNTGPTTVDGGQEPTSDSPDGTANRGAPAPDPDGGRPTRESGGRERSSSHEEPAPRPERSTHAPNTNVDTSPYSFDAPLNPTAGERNASAHPEDLGVDDAGTLDDQDSDVSSVFDTEDVDNESLATDLSDTEAPVASKDGQDPHAPAFVAGGRKPDPLDLMGPTPVSVHPVFTAFDAGAEGPRTSRPPSAGTGPERGGQEGTTTPLGSTPADSRAETVRERLPLLTRHLTEGDLGQAWALGGEVQRLLTHRPDEGIDQNPSIRQARDLSLALMYVLSDPSNRTVPLSVEDLPSHRIDDALSLVGGIERNLQDRDDPVRARLWLPGGRLTTDYVVEAMRDPADRAPLSEEPAPGTSPDLTVNVMTHGEGPAHGLGRRDSDGILRFPGGVGLLDYGDLLHDPAFNPNTHDALPARTRRHIQAYTAESWIAEFSRLRPLNEETVQAELDRRREESRAQPGWLLYEIGNGRWPDLRILRPQLDGGRLTPEQERVVRQVLGSPDPETTLDDLRTRAGSAGLIAETLPDKRGNGSYPDAQDVLEVIERLDHATRHPLPEGVEAVRGVYGFEHLGAGSTRDPQSLVGKTYTDPGYMSLSLGDRPGAAGGSPTDLIRFTLPPGTRGLWVGDRSLHPHERELILPRDTAYQVTSVEPWGRGHLLHARIIPPGPSSDLRPVTESSNEVTVMAVTGIEGSVRAPNPGESSLPDPDALARGMGLADGTGEAEGSSAEGTSTAPLESIRATVTRLTSDITALVTDARSTDTTTRDTAFDRLQQAGDSLADLATRAATIASATPEALDITARLAMDIATAAHDMAKLSADTAAKARDDVREVPSPLPGSLDEITSLAEARDTAGAHVATAGTARDAADRAARVAARVTEAITRVTEATGGQAQRHSEQTRSVSERAEGHLRSAKTAATEAAGRHESLVVAVDGAASNGVERALKAAATAHTNVENAAKALATARANAETAAGDADNARTLTVTATTNGDRDQTVAQVLRALGAEATARTEQGTIHRQAGIIREETESGRRALAEAGLMAALTSEGSPARERSTSERVTFTDPAEAGRSEAERKAETAVGKAGRAAREALSLPLQALEGRTGLQADNERVRQALVRDVPGFRAEAARAAQDAASRLDTTRVMSDSTTLGDAARDAETAARTAEARAREARTGYEDVRAASAGFAQRYEAALREAAADADTIQRIADRAPERRDVVDNADRARTEVQRARTHWDSIRDDHAAMVDRTLREVSEEVRRTEDRAVQARRDADEARAQAERPREYPGTLDREEDPEQTYDLDYLVRSRLITPDRLHTERVPEVAGYLIAAQVGDARLRTAVRSEIDEIARTRGMASFFSPEGVTVSVRLSAEGAPEVVRDASDGDASVWRTRVALSPTAPAGFRHMDLSHPESGSPKESREEARGHGTARGGTTGHDPRRGLRARFTGSPLLLGDVTGLAAGPWVTAGGGYTRGQRSGSATGGDKVDSAVEYNTFGSPEVYLSDLRVEVEVTPPSQRGTPAPTTPAPGPQSGAITNGMALVLPGKVNARPEGLQASIDLSSDRGSGATTPARLSGRPLGGLPISVSSITERGASDARTDLGSWLADRLVSPEYLQTMGESMPRLSKERTRRKIDDWKKDIREAFDNDSIQKYLPHLDTGPMTLSVTHPLLGEVMLDLSSVPTRYSARKHTPLIDEATLKHTVASTTALSQSRESSVTASVGAGFGIVVPLPSGGSIRLNMPHLEYTWQRSFSSQTESVKTSAERRSLIHHVSATETFTAFDVERTLSVRIQGEPTPHTFEVNSTEILPGESSAALQRAASGEEAASDADSTRTPPYPHLRHPRVVDFSGTHHHGLGWDHAPARGQTDPAGTESTPLPPNDSGVLETITDRVLKAIADRHPGLVIPEAARTREDYAERPGGSKTHRSPRELPILRRSYPVAYQNTMDVRDAIRDAMSGDNRDRLASGDGLRVLLREPASVDPELMKQHKELMRPDVLTLSLKADFSALSHEGRTTAETGKISSASTTLGSTSAKGSSHALALSFGSGMVRSGEADARGLARFLGGFMASIGGSLANRKDASHSLSSGSDQQLIFPGGSDLWGGTAVFTARLYNDDSQVMTGGTERGVDLLDVPVNARYSLTTPVKTTEVPVRGGQDQAPSHQVLQPEESRALIDPDPAGATDPLPRSMHAQRTQDMLDNGAIIEGLGLNALGDGTAGPPRGILQRTFEAFPERRFLTTGDKGRLRGFLDTIGGRHFFTNFLSTASLASDPATFTLIGHRGRIDMSGTWRAPNDMRATGTTSIRPERITGMHALETQVAISAETVSSAGSSEQRTTSANLGINAHAGGTGNPIVQDQAGSGAGRPLSQFPVPLAGPSHTWNFFRRGDKTDSGVSSASKLLLVSDAATAYTFRMSGTISQAWELKKHVGVHIPGWWSLKYLGWKARVADLVSGHITARDAERAGIIDDAVVRDDGDGSLSPGTQDNPAPPTDLDVRSGFDGAGQQIRPADPLAAIHDLETNLRDKNLELTRDSKERLLTSLTKHLGNTSGALPPIPVKVVPASGVFKRSAPARILVEVSRTDPRIDYVSSAVASIETHTWTSKETRERSKGTGHTSGVSYTPWQPTTYEGQDKPTEEQKSHIFLLSPAAGVTAGRASTESHSSANERTHTVVMESSGPFAKVAHDTTITLTLEAEGRDSVKGQGDGGTVRTFHLGSSLGPRTRGPVDALESVPSPPTVTSRAGDTLAGAVADTTGALGTPSPALVDSIIMPTAVHGPGLQDTAIHVIARSLGWTPTPGPDHGENPTARQREQIRDHQNRDTRAARHHIADRLELDGRYTPIDNLLTPHSLKGLFSRLIGHPEGVDFLNIGGTEWRVAATPDFDNARILTARSDSRIAYREAEQDTSSHTLSHSGGTAPTVGFRPTGSEPVDPRNEDRAAFLTGSGDVVTESNGVDSRVGNSIGTGRPSDMERQRLGTAYLVEFDTTWTIGARSENRTAFGKAAQQFTGDRKTKVSAWISHKDAIALGITTPEQADSAAAVIAAEHQASTSMSKAEGTYIAERAKLPVLVDAYLRAHSDHEAAPTDRTRAALDTARTAYDAQNAVYQEALRKYNAAIRAWIGTLTATHDHFDPDNAASPYNRPLPPTASPTGSVARQTAEQRIEEQNARFRDILNLPLAPRSS